MKFTCILNQGNVWPFTEGCTAVQCSHLPSLLAYWWLLRQVSIFHHPILHSPFYIPFHWSETLCRAWNKDEKMVGHSFTVGTQNIIIGFRLKSIFCLYNFWLFFIEFFLFFTNYSSYNLMMFHAYQFVLWHNKTKKALKTCTEL